MTSLVIKNKLPLQLDYIIYSVDDKKFFHQETFSTWYMDALFTSCKRFQNVEDAIEIAKKFGFKNVIIIEASSAAHHIRQSNIIEHSAWSWNYWVKNL